MPEICAELVDEVTTFFEEAEKNIAAHPAESVVGALLVGALIGLYLSSHRRSGDFDMIENLVRDLQVLRKADFFDSARFGSGSSPRQFSFGLFAFAGLVAVFGLGMANVAGFYALQVSAGPIWGAANMLPSSISSSRRSFCWRRLIPPRPEMELAFDVRKMAIEHKLNSGGRARSQARRRWPRSGDSGGQGERRWLRAQSLGRRGTEAPCSCCLVDYQGNAIEESAILRDTALGFSHPIADNFAQCA